MLENYTVYLSLRALSQLYSLSFPPQSEIPEAIQHYLLALQLEPGFTPAVERLKIIQCVLWKQQKALEKEAADLRKLLTPK